MKTNEKLQIDIKILVLHALLNNKERNTHLQEWNLFKMKLQKNISKDKSQHHSYSI